jgi:LysR family hydrogen peroxide-inducible transcriptional activator
LADAEAYLGATLVERAHSGAYLTPVGTDIVRRARIILTQVEDLKAAARLTGQGLAGHYRLGTTPTIGPYLLPQAARRLHSLHPNLKMSVREERTIDLQAKLEDGRLDMAISTPEDHPGTDSMPLFDEHLWICVAEDDPLANSSGDVNLADLGGRAVLSLGFGYRLSIIVQQLADAAGAHVSTEYEGTSLDAIRQMAAMGAGVAILPSLYARREATRDPSLIIRRLDHSLAIRHIGLVWRRDSPLSVQMTEFGTVLRQIAEELI